MDKSVAELIGIRGTLEEISTTLLTIKDFMGLQYNMLQAIEAQLNKDGVQRAPRADLLMSPNELGFDPETTPREWLEKLRLIPRVIAKLNLSIQPGCWIYTGIMTQGQMLIYHPITQKKVTLRKYMYEYLVGPLPDGHRTSRPECHELCVHPHHLKIDRHKIHVKPIEESTEFNTYMVGMEKQRKNLAERNGQTYRPFPTSHWDIVYRMEKGEVISEQRFGAYQQLNGMYHYLDPIVQSPARDRNVPTDVEWMNSELGPARPQAPSIPQSTLADVLGMK